MTVMVKRNRVVTEEIKEAVIFSILTFFQW